MSGLAPEAVRLARAIDESGFLLIGMIHLHQLMTGGLNQLAPPCSPPDSTVC